MSNDNMQVVVAKPDGTAMVNTASRVLAGTQGLVIDSPSLYESASTDLKAIKGRMNEIEGLRVALVTPFNTAVKNLNDIFRAPRDLYEQAEKNIKLALTTYDREQERKRAEEAAAARRQAEEAAAKERARLAAVAAAEEVKAREAAEKLQKEANEAAAAGRAEQAAKLQVQAQAKIDAGLAKAEALAEQSANVIVAPIAVVTQAAPKVAGISTRQVWKGEVFDKAALIKYVAANPQYLNLLDVNMTAVNGLAKSLKDQMNIDGVRAVSESQIASRAA